MKKLKEILENVEYELIKGSIDVEIKDIKDNYEKTIITMDKLYANTSEDGIKIKYLIDFLMGD